MNDLGSILQRPWLAAQQGPWFERRYGVTLPVLVATLLLMASALSRSFFDGRLAAPMTHDDVNYFIEGIQRLTILRTQGFFALVSDFFHGFLHAPLSTYQAMLAYLIFGVEDWAPYVTNIVYVVVFLGFAAWLVRDCPAIVLAAVMACLIAMPISSNTITEFAPERVCSLFTAIGAVLLVRQSLFDAPLASRFYVGLCFGVAFLAHPVASPFTMIALVATLGLNFLRDIGWPWELKKLKIGLVKSLVNIALSVWLPALYIVPRFHEYWKYFHDAITNPRWVYETHHLNLDHPLFYLVGNGGRFMFGDKLWAYAGIVCLGIFAAGWRRDRESVICQVQLALLAFVFWLVPALAPEKNHLYGLAFGFTVAFMTVIALASIYRAIPSARGAAVVSILAFSLFVYYQPADVHIPNTPGSVLERELTWQTIDRITANLFGNAVDQHGIKVYETNIGAYAPNILQYYLLKKDPTLDWKFESLAYDSNAEHHIDFIRGSEGDYTSTRDFVIAGERYNGLTYQPQAGPAEDTVYAAMWRDPGFMALDRFYGPGGREVTIFARRGSFGGWRPVSTVPTVIRNSAGQWIRSKGGAAHVVPSYLPQNTTHTLLRWSRKDDQRYAAGGLIYLQAFAARPVAADLQIEWVGEASGQKLTIVVNQENVAELTFTASEISSLKQQIRLSRGTNDIVLKSDAPVKLDHLLIVPHVAGKPPDQGISVATATYGRNCDAPQGNATRDVEENCGGKSYCEHKIQSDRLGDPAQGCDKDFAVSYFCPSESAMRHNKLPANSEGKTLSLSCGFEKPPPPIAEALPNFSSLPSRSDIVTKVTDISELPPLTHSSSAPDKWDFVEGLSVEVVQASTVNSGENILRLVAAGDPGRHALAARFSTSAPGRSELSGASMREILVAVAEPGGIYRAVEWVKSRFRRLVSDPVYRATAWIKAEPGVRVMIEVRDSFDPNTGKPWNYGVGRFNLGARSVVEFHRRYTRQRSGSGCG